MKKYSEIFPEVKEKQIIRTDDKIQKRDGEQKDNMKTSADKRRRTSMMDIKVGDVVLCRKERKTTA